MTLNRRTKWIYGFGDISFSVTNTILAVYFAIFLTDVVGLPASLAALAIFLGRSWDYINDPLIGHLSDRMRTRWGRRRPFLIFGALPFGLCFIMLWVRPPLANQFLLASYYALAYMLFDLTFTLTNMPYAALTPELTEDYDERTSLTSYRMLFSIAGSLIAFTIPLAIIGSLIPENAGRVREMAVLFGLLCMLPILLVFFNTRERPDYMQAQQPRLIQSLRAALKNRPFIFGAVIFLLTWVAIDILQTALLFFIKYALLREDQSDLIMGAIFITAIIALPLWVWMAHNWNKRLAYIFGIAFWAAVQVVLVTVTADTGLPWIMTLCIMAGIGISAAHVLTWAIIPDAIEWDELQTGKRHEGMFYSLVSLMQKVASSIAIPLILLLLDRTGYIPNAAVQQPSALFGIRLVVGPIPALLLLSGIVFAYFYPLGRAEYNEVVMQLEERRATALEPPEVL
ncbi:MAG: hypothetical protein B6D39_03845 [Anaerolineae bacterium UTCFX2]|jgi:GPH family glycoside/pentoside/hexuronide:cation symporter|nr:MAG: hypothetical protein B6D39_03845 [Anaerolineae bacterium UTCFX2]